MLNFRKPIEPMPNFVAAPLKDVSFLMKKNGLKTSDIFTRKGAYRRCPTSPASASPPLPPPPPPHSDLNTDGDEHISLKELTAILEKVTLVYVN